MNNFKIKSFGETHPSGSIGKSLTPIKELLITGKNIPFIDSQASFSKVLSVIAKKRLGCVLVKDKKLNKLLEESTVYTFCN